MIPGDQLKLCAVFALAIAVMAGPISLHADDGITALPDRITVTTSRRAKPLSDIAGNLAQLTRDDIDLIRADHISEAVNRLPGLNIQRGNGQEHLTAIRSPVLTGGAGAGSFLYLEDGIPLRAAGFANVNGLFEAHSELAESIEVVRGPGSALYGSNAVHGLINVLTPAPSDEMTGFVEGLWGSFGRGRLRSSVSGSQGDHGFYGGVTLLHENGFRQDAGLDQQKISLRYDFSSGPTQVTAILSAHNLNQETAGFIQGPDAYKDSGFGRTNPFPEAFRDTRAVRAALRWEQTLSNNLTATVTPYGRWNEMEFLLHFLPSRALEENGHRSAGVLSTLYWTPHPDAEIVAGIDLEVTDGFLREVQSRPSFGSFPQGVHYNYDVVSTVAAFYVHGEWQFQPRLRLVGGLRYEFTRYDYDNKTDSNTVGRFQRPVDRDDEFSVVTPKLGLIYDAGADTSVFVNLARGARAPQTTDLYRLQINQTVGEIEEEKLDSAEIGMRGALCGMTYEAAAFYMEKRNFFFRDADGFNVPDGKTRHVGVEAELFAPLTDYLALSATATYARHTYTFNNDVARTSEIIRDGNDVDTAPRVISNVRLLWTFLDNGQAELEWQHMGRYYTDAANDNDYPGHDVINARIRWSFTENVELFATVRNVTNTDYAERADFAFGNERFFPGEDRAYEAGLSVRF